MKTSSSLVYQCNSTRWNPIFLATHLCTSVDCSMPCVPMEASCLVVLPRFSHASVQFGHLWERLISCENGSAGLQMRFGQDGAHDKLQGCSWQVQENCVGHFEITYPH